MAPVAQVACHFLAIVPERWFSLVLAPIPLSPAKAREDDRNVERLDL
jgi:hypothetical protein